MLNFEEIDKARRLLELLKEATLKEIKDAYRSKAKEYHPDKQSSKNKEYNKKMIELNKAYKILLDYVREYKFSFSEEEVKRNDPHRDMRRFSGDWLGER